MTKKTSSTKTEIKELKARMAALEERLRAKEPILFPQYLALASLIAELGAAAAAPGPSYLPRKQQIEMTLLRHNRYMSKEEILDDLEKHGYVTGKAQRGVMNTTLNYHSTDTNNLPWVDVDGTIYIGLEGFEKP